MERKTRNKTKKINKYKGGGFFSTPTIEESVKPVKTEIKRFEPVELEVKKGIIFKSTKYIPKEIVEFNGKKYSIEKTKDMFGRRKIIIRDRESGQLLERKDDPTSHFILRNYIKKYPSRDYHSKNEAVYHQYYNESRKHKFLRANQTTKKMVGTPVKLQKPRNWWTLGLFRKKKVFTGHGNPEEKTLEATRDRVRELEAQAKKNSEARQLYQAEIRAKEEKAKLAEAKAKATAIASSMPTA